MKELRLANQLIIFLFYLFNQKISEDKAPCLNVLFVVSSSEVNFCALKIQWLLVVVKS